MNLPEQWQVHIAHGDGFLTKIFIFRRNDGFDEFFYPGPDGTHDIKRVTRTEDPAPSLVIPMRSASGILRGFAEALATHGFATLDTGGAVRSKDAHIASLEKMNDRLYTLAERTPVMIKMGGQS